MLDKKHYWKPILLLIGVYISIILGTIFSAKFFIIDKPKSEQKIYSLVEGTVCNKKTYFLINMDPNFIQSSSPKLVLDSNSVKIHMNEENIKSVYDSCEVSLNGLNITYQKEYTNLKPLIEEIKQSTGYEISGVIGNTNVEVKNF